MGKHIVIEGRKIQTESIEELEKIVTEYGINTYYANWHVKDIKEFINYCREIQSTSIYKQLSIEFSYDNKISWIGLKGKGDSYGSVQLYCNGKVKTSILKEVMTFAEASEMWGLGESTLRSTVKTDKLIENIDYKKSGKVWLITKDAMVRIYGTPLQNK